MDLDSKLKVPVEVADTQLRPDMLLLSRGTKRMAGLPTYSDPPIFTPISDLVSAGSDFRDCTPLFEIPIIGRIFSV